MGNEVQAGGPGTAATGGVLSSTSHEVLLEGPVGATLLAGAAATGGRVSFLIHPLAPRALGSPLHTHRDEDEWTYVLDGTVGVQIADRDYSAGVGDLILKPRGVPHAFWNSGDEPARLLEVITPGGFEGYFARLGEVLGGGGPPDLAALAQVAADYNLDLDPASIPRLAETHGLRLE